MFVLFILVCILMTVYHLNITSEGKPLFTGDTAGFFDCFVKGYMEMFISNGKMLSYCSILITDLTGISLLAVNRDIIELDFSMMGEIDMRKAEIMVLSESEIKSILSTGKLPGKDATKKPQRMKATAI